MLAPQPRWTPPRPAADDESPDSRMPEVVLRAKSASTSLVAGPAAEVGSGRPTSHHPARGVPLVSTWMRRWGAGIHALPLARASRRGRRAGRQHIDSWGHPGRRRR